MGHADFRVGQSHLQVGHRAMEWLTSVSQRGHSTLEVGQIRSPWPTWNWEWPTSVSQRGHSTLEVGQMKVPMGHADLRVGHSILEMGQRRALWPTWGLKWPTSQFQMGQTQSEVGQARQGSLLWPSQRWVTVSLRRNSRPARTRAACPMRPMAETMTKASFFGAGSTPVAPQK